jgi:hypothetical protein
MSFAEILVKKLRVRAAERAAQDQTGEVSAALFEVAGIAEQAHEEAKREWPHRERNEHEAQA